MWLTYSNYGNAAVGQIVRETPKQFFLKGAWGRNRIVRKSVNYIVFKEKEDAEKAANFFNSTMGGIRAVYRDPLRKANDEVTRIRGALKDEKDAFTKTFFTKTDHVGQVK